MAEQINLVGNFTDNITPKLKKLDRELKNITKAFTKLGGKIRPVTKEMGKLAMATERVATSLKAQRQDITSTTQAMRAYTTASKKAATQQRKMKPARMPRAPRASRGAAGGGGGGGGIGIGGLIGGSVISGLMTNAIIQGFRAGVQLMMAPFKAFASAFAERMGDEMADIQSAGGMFALDKKAGGTLFGNDFGKARQMQERLNASLAQSAAALPGATNDYVKAARGVTDTVMMAFGKNEEAFKSFAVELGGKQGGTSEEAITKVLSRFTEQTVLLGMGGAKGGMPLTMLMEQLVTQDGVNIQGMKKRYAQLRQNPLLATMLEDAQAEINATGAGSADRMRAVMKALDNALPQQVVNAMRRSMDGLVEATRSAFFDPDTGLLGLSRKMKFMFEGVEVESSVFEELRSIAANMAVPLMELLNFLPQIFDPFANLMPTLRKFRNYTKMFFDDFEGLANGFEDMAISMEAEAKKMKKGEARDLKFGQAKNLKSQAGSRGALTALNRMMKSFGLIDADVLEDNLKRLYDISPEGIDFNFSDMAVTMLKQFAASPMVSEFVATIGKVLGQLTATIATAIKSILDSSKDGTGNELIDTLVTSFKEGLGKVDVEAIMSQLMERLIGAATNFIVNKGLPALFNGLGMVIESTWKAGPGGKFLVIAGSLLAFSKALAVVQGVMAAFAGLQAVGTAFSGTALAGTIAGNLPVAATAITTAFTGLSTFITATLIPAIGAVAAPILILVGAALGLGAVFRHLDLIVDSAAASLKFLGAGFDMLMGHLMQAVGGLLQKFSWMGLGDAGDKLVEDGKAKVEGGELQMAAAVERMSANTTASFDRTRQDFTDIGNKLGIASDEQLVQAKATAEASNKTADETRAVVIGTQNITAAIRAMPTQIGPPAPTTAVPKYNGRGRSMSLGSAIATENRHKPAGSSLVIANSSESVIPANKGYSPYGGGGSMNVTNNFTINGGGMDPQALAEQVAAVVMNSVEEASYSEIYTS